MKKDLIVGLIIKHLTVAKQSFQNKPLFFIAITIVYRPMTRSPDCLSLIIGLHESRSFLNELLDCWI